MGNNHPKLKVHLATAEKTGALQMRNTQLRQIPDAVAASGSKFRLLDFSTNQLRTFPLNRFPNAKRLALDSNQIAALPDEFAACSKTLEQLSLQANQLATLPPSLAQLGSLKTLNVSANQLTAFPRAICQLLRLESIDLAQNQMSGSIPDEIGQLERLQELNCNSNQLSRLPSAALATGCRKLKVLRLQENCLPIEEMTPQLMSDSSISTLQIEGNLFDMKKFELVQGYDAYVERYTAAKRKMY